MARRKHYSKSNGRFGGVSNIVRSAGMGLLGAMVVGAVVNKVAPQYSGIASIGGAYLVGGPIGALATVFINGIPSLQASGSNGLTVV